MQNPLISQEEVLFFLKKRRNILEGVCITGGEPTIHPELPDFLYKVKELGYKVKLDTNGNNPLMLKELYHDQLINYVAMDIKNSKEKYPQSIGIEHFFLDHVCESVSIIMNSTIPYEFRTTVVKELHTDDDFISIGKWITGAKSYYLQSFKDSDTIIKPGLSAYDKEELFKFIALLTPFVPSVSLRGVE